ncbi:hypothetical protein R1flu_029167 [Riccia fluitans]|uniref:Uncharacterized protein n=1 Tax=Riccia fluitans TaxID=41844 RepID=A0ABD1XNT7_9MARC
MVCLNLLLFQLGVDFNEERINHQSVSGAARHMNHPIHPKSVEAFVLEFANLLRSPESATTSRYTDMIVLYVKYGSDESNDSRTRTDQGVVGTGSVDGDLSIAKSIVLLRNANKCTCQ